MDKPQENWITVYQQEIVREELDDPLWLNEVLEDNNIPYRNEDRAVLEGSYDSFRATVDRFVLIPPEYKEQMCIRDRVRLIISHLDCRNRLKTRGKQKSYKSELSNL